MPKVSETYKEERRIHLVSAAERVFLRQGYVHTTVQHILAEAQVSRGAFYLYFHNKVDVFEAVLHRQDQRYFEEIARIRASHQPLGPAFLALALPSPEMPPDERRRVAMVVEYHLEHRDNPTVRERIQQRMVGAVTAISALLQDGVDRGEFNPVLPLTTIIYFFMAADDGWSIYRTVLGDTRLGDVEFAGALRLFLQQNLGLTTAPASSGQDKEQGSRGRRDRPR